MLRVKGLDREHPEVLYCLIATLNRRHLKGKVEDYQQYLEDFVEDTIEPCLWDCDRGDDLSQSMNQLLTYL